MLLILQTLLTVLCNNCPTLCVQDANLSANPMAKTWDTALPASGLMMMVMAGAQAGQAVLSKQLVNQKFAQKITQELF